MKRILALSLAVLLLCLAARGYAATIYVDSTRPDDTGNGLTPETARKDVYAVSQLAFQPGDVIRLVRGSTWTVAAWAPAVSGSEASPITVEAWGTGAPPVIDSGASGVPALYIAAKNYWNVKGLDLRTSGAKVAQITGYGNVIENCAASGTGAAGTGAGFLAAWGGGTIFRRCTVTGVIGHGFWIYDHPAAVLEDCTAIGVIHGGGFLFDLGSIGCIGRGLVARGGKLAAGVENNSPSGFRMHGTATVDLFDCLSEGNEEDGYDADASGVGARMRLYRCKSVGNGIPANVTSGDGFTAHSASRLEMYDCIAQSNWRDGLGIANSQGGRAERCVFADNGKFHPDLSVGLLVSGGAGASGSWAMVGCTIYGQRYHVYIDAAAVTAGFTLFSEGNRFMNSLPYYLADTLMNFSGYMTATGDTTSQEVHPSWGVLPWGGHWGRPPWQ